MNNSATETTILQVPVEDIIPNRFQPRLAFNDDSLSDLATSIKQHGIIQPLVLRRKADKYEIIAGERRFKAAKMAGLISVPAIISNLDDNTSAEVAIVENVQRKNLTAIEEAKSYQALLDKGYMTQEELAKRMGLSQSSIANKLRLLTLDESVQDAVLNEKISERHARSLLRVANKIKQKELVQKIINERLTVRQLDEEIKKMAENIPLDLREEAPIINNVPNISDIVNNSVSINRDEKEIVHPEATLSENNIFSNAEKMPNKFFNFLEDQAANMDFTEQNTTSFDAPSVEQPKEESAAAQLDNTEDIEMLDDFFSPTTSTMQSQDEYCNTVINTIRNLNLDKDRVVIEEINLPQEYRVNITIKKNNQQ